MLLHLDIAYLPPPPLLPAIQQLFSQANGGFIMSASHNPGGPEYDWGIKVNFRSHMSSMYNAIKLKVFVIVVLIFEFLYTSKYWFHSIPFKARFTVFPKCY